MPLPAPIAPPSPSERPHILLCVPDSEQQDAIFAALSSAGYRVLTLQSIDEYPHVCANDQCASLVIADLDGGAASYVLAFLAQCHSLPAAILLSSNPSFSLRLAVARAGSFRILEKPVDVQRLVAIVGQKLGPQTEEPYRILLVDDDPLTSEYHATLLRSSGMGVVSVRTPDDALVVASQYRPDLILLDYYLEKCTGAELITMLREDDQFALIPALFLSAGEQQELERDILENLGEEFLRKPIQPASFVNTVRSRAKYARHSQRLTSELQYSQRASRYLRQSLDEHAIISVANAQGDLIYANDKFCEVSGYTREELLGRNHRVVKSSLHDKSFYEQMWSTITSGQVWHGDVCNRRKDGEFYWVSATIIPCLDEQGLPYQYVSVRTDITDLKKTQARLTSLVNSANVGLAWLNPAGQFIDCNDTFLAMLGYGREDFLSHTNLQVTYPDDLELTNNYMTAILDGELEFVRVEKRYVRSDGEVIWGDLTLARISDSQGRMQGMSGTVIDITARKQAEQQLLAAKVAAEQANAAKSEFLSRMSHELRTPMNAILGFAQVMDADPLDPPSPSQKECLQQILRAGWHLLELINEVLDLAKIEAGKVNIQLTDVCVNQVIQDSLNLVSPLAEVAGITLINPLVDSAQIYVRADATRLKQVFLNLLSNAVKYNRPSGMVKIAFQAEADRWRISIVDTGIGMSESQLADLFQPFTRFVDDSQKIEGTGIGLTITKRLTEMMQGTLVVESTVGKGSSFSVLLPMSQAQLENLEENAQLNLSSGDISCSCEDRMLDVLYIEANPVNQQVLAKLAERLPQLHVRYASNGAEGLQSALTIAPDLILMDVNLPDLDGFSLKTCFDTEPSLDDVPMVVLSADAMPEDIERGREAGFADYLAKPVKVGELMAWFERACRLKAEKKQ